MNYGRGTPVAHTYLQTLADFGQPVIDLARVGEDFDLTRIEGAQFRPRLDTEAARHAADFLLELLQFAHPESLVCDWDKRIALFSDGHAAMTYGWSIRASAFELRPGAAAHGVVRFLPHPPAPGARPVSPIGGFSLSIPTRLDEARRLTAWKMLQYLTRPELLKWYVQNGNLTSARFSTSADPEVRAQSGLIAAVDDMERRGEVQIWPRPPIPEFSSILRILGEDIHAMLRRACTPAEALATAQGRIDALMREDGRY
jgi:multiple sugar transport system substrate-binding protein